MASSGGSILEGLIMGQEAKDRRADRQRRIALDAADQEMRKQEMTLRQAQEDRLSREHATTQAFNQIWKTAQADETRARDTNATEDRKAATEQRKQAAKFAHADRREANRGRLMQMATGQFADPNEGIAWVKKQDQEWLKDNPEDDFVNRAVSTMPPIPAGKPGGPGGPGLPMGGAPQGGMPQGVGLPVQPSGGIPGGGLPGMPPPGMGGGMMGAQGAGMAGGAPFSGPPQGGGGFPVGGTAAPPVPMTKAGAFVDNQRSIGANRESLIVAREIMNKVRQAKSDRDAREAPAKEEWYKLRNQKTAKELTHLEQIISDFPEAQRFHRALLGASIDQKKVITEYDRQKMAFDLRMQGGKEAEQSEKIRSLRVSTNEKMALITNGLDKESLKFKGHVDASDVALSEAQVKYRHAVTNRAYVAKTATPEQKSAVDADVEAAKNKVEQATVRRDAAHAAYNSFLDGRNNLQADWDGRKGTLPAVRGLDQSKQILGKPYKTKSGAIFTPLP